MPWARLDDVFPEHPKVWSLSDGAYRLLTSAVCHSAKFLLDGVIEQSRLAGLVPKYRVSYLDELVERRRVHRPGHDCGECVEPPKGALVIHGYLDCNPSKEKVEHDRAAAAARKAAFLAKKARNAARNEGQNGAGNGVPNASPAQPSPTQPVGHWVGVGGPQADVSSPSPSAGDDEVEVVPIAAAVTAAREHLKPKPIPGPEGSRTCPCEKPWPDCDGSCPKLAAAVEVVA